MKYPPEYVLDRMEWYEINAAMKYQYYSIKEGWEQARLIAYMVAQVNSKRTLKMEEILQFPWEKEDADKSSTSITKEEIEKLKAEASEYLKNKNKETRKD